MPNKAPAIHSARQVTGNIDIGREGEVVTLKIGTSVLRFRYRDAMKIGQAMMIKAQECKMLTGDTKRIITERR